MRLVQLAKAAWGQAELLTSRCSFSSLSGWTRSRG